MVESTPTAKHSTLAGKKKVENTPVVHPAPKKERGSGLTGTHRPARQIHSPAIAEIRLAWIKFGRGSGFGRRALARPQMVKSNPASSSSGSTNRKDISR